MAVDIPRTNGALLLGALVAMFLSGIMSTQVVIYIKMYPKDPRAIKILVGAIWLLDLSHSSLTCASIWTNLIHNFGVAAKVDYVPWTLPMTIVLTSLITILAHSFFTYRIWKLSKGNLFITIPIILIALTRLGSAFSTSITLGSLHSYHHFLEKYPWLPTLGLVLSSGVDMLITFFLCYYLKGSQSGNSRLDHAVDLLMLYAFENCALTSAATIATMICWLTMPHNLIFMGIHFVVAKLYANSVLVSLNTRKEIRSNMRRGHPFPIVVPRFFKRKQDDFPSGATSLSTDPSSALSGTELDSMKFHVRTAQVMTLDSGKSLPGTTTLNTATHSIEEKSQDQPEHATPTGGKAEQLLGTGAQRNNTLTWAQS